MIRSVIQLIESILQFSLYINDRRIFRSDSPDSYRLAATIIRCCSTSKDYLLGLASHNLVRYPACHTVDVVTYIWMTLSFNR